MGIFTTVNVGEKEGQVKCWNENLLGVELGDKVPDIEDEYTYVVAMREGGYLIIFKNTLIAWEEEVPEESFLWPCFDKWGEKFVSNKENSGLLGEPYLYRK